jgi:hypothetical protein
MWDLWWTKRHWRRFSPSTSVSPASYATNFSIVIITRGWHNRPISGRSAEWTQLDSTPHYTDLKFKTYVIYHRMLGWPVNWRECGRLRSWPLSMSEFAWRDWGEPQTHQWTEVEVVGVWAEIWTRHLPTNDKRYRMSQLARRVIW